ncbi:biotin--[acetyl-CoA-carboxylase] ligase [Thiotrichales bacterium 19S3-7]|nr:biotin--[acetyl-CoA-carboxylase] ligase [Thiotrichales bacterium 19S3-7]MCF6802717.1 biotin--[acetyl-CoA-carboxylase] ligase [Thiotrichales bacterium 19S3-11]
MKQTSTTLIQFCNLLSDLEIHDGNEIGEKLNVSRTAIWKYVKKLQNYGIEIASIKSKGYQFKNPLLLIDKYRIHQAINTIKTIHIYECLDSTNDYLSALKTTATDLPIICIAEKQTKGKGRFGKPWYAPFGDNIYLSIAVAPEIDITQLSGLALAVGIGIIQAVETICQLPKQLKLKWPNDIFYENKKLGGILIEAQAEANGQCRLVIGIGININMQCDSQANKSITQPWSSIYQASQIYQDRNPLIISMIQHTLKVIETYQLNGLTPFLPQWHKRDLLFNQTVDIVSGKHSYHGIAKGINEHGHLKLELNDNNTKIFASGEASIKR